MGLVRPFEIAETFYPEDQALVEPCRSAGLDEELAQRFITSQKARDETYVLADSYATKLIASIVIDSLNVGRHQHAPVKIYVAVYTRARLVSYVTECAGAPVQEEHHRPDLEPVVDRVIAAR